MEEVFVQSLLYQLEGVASRLDFPEAVVENGSLGREFVAPDVS